MEPREPSQVDARAVGRPWTIGAFVLAAAAFLLSPIIFGPIGAIVGWMGYRKGDRLGLWAMWTAIGAALATLLLAAVVVANPGSQ